MGARLIQFLRVEGQTEGGLYARAEGLSVTEGNDTRVVDLGLDEGRRVEVCLGANFQCNTSVGGLGVVYSLGAGLDVATDTVVVRRGEGIEVVETVQGDGVFGGIVPDGGSVAGDVATGDVVRSFGAEKEAVAAQNGVCSESGTLEERKRPS
jgi:hypothetical protein